MIENWRDISGLEDCYQVSDLGRVRSKDRWSATAGGGRRFWKQRVLKHQKNTADYDKVTLWREGVSHQHFVHKLVLEHFVGPRPEGMQGCHRDGNRRNNALSNLRWGTPSSNQSDRENHGTSQRGKRRHDKPFTADEVAEIRYLGILETTTEVARRFGRPRTSVADIINERTWKGGVNGRNAA